MRIESKGIVISEIFKGLDEGETIEISADGNFITLTLINEDGRQGFNFDTETFRELLVAMKRADQEIENIRNPTAAA